MELASICSVGASAAAHTVESEVHMAMNDSCCDAKTSEKNDSREDA